MNNSLHFLSVSDLMKISELSGTPGIILVQPLIYKRRKLGLREELNLLESPSELIEEARLGAVLLSPNLVFFRPFYSVPSRTVLLLPLLLVNISPSHLFHSSLSAQEFVHLPWMFLS